MKVGDVVYTTRYALSGGVKEALVESVGRINHDLVNLDRYKQLFHVGVDVFATREEAVKVADEMRSGKLAQLQEKIEKIRSFMHK